LVAVAVLSGNRNFEGRIHPLVRANYLASPALVIAYALAGRMDIDFAKDPLGYDKSNQPIYLADIFPTQADTHQIVSSSLKPELFIERYKNVFDGNERWNSLNVSSSVTYDWQHSSTYIQEPPFFKDFSLSIPPLKDIIGARVLVYLGDSITTDHISPAGSIAPDSPAGKYLISQGVEPADFNSYGARRGNDQVMTRGTFANVRLKNKLVPGKEGGITKYFPSNEVMPIYDAAMQYKALDVPLIVIAGKEYGSGSSRDWAAKGTALLGIKAVLAESFERIHRSNLVGMVILPLQFLEGENAEALELTGEEIFDIPLTTNPLQPRMQITITAHKPNGSSYSFTVIIRLDTNQEITYYLHGGILPFVLRECAKS
jgi:aconitate hydratase